MCLLRLALPSYVVRGYKPEDKGYEHHKFPAPEMCVMYNNQMGNVDKSNFYAHLEHYSMSSAMHCKKWWKRVNNGLFDMARTNAMVAWTQARKGRSHALFIDTLIDQYVNNRLDEGYSWKEMRTGCPAPEKGITRISAALRKQLVDRLVSVVINDKEQVTYQKLPFSRYVCSLFQFVQNSKTLPVLFETRQKGDENTALLCSVWGHTFMHAGRHKKQLLDKLAQDCV